MAMAEAIPLFLLLHLLPLGLVAPSPLELPSLTQSPPLRFNKPNFRIALFADLHYGEDAWEDWGPAQDRNSTRVMSYVLDVEKPDFVIFLGDILTANNLPLPNATAYWDQALLPASDRNIPWASVFGNHDDMAFEWPLEWFGTSGIPGIEFSSSGGSVVHHYFCGVTREELIQNEVKKTLSFSERGPKALWPSMSNYALEVSSLKYSASTAAILYFLDSGGGSYPEVISARQLAWFQKVSAKLNPDAKIPEILFWHIPSLAYKLVAPCPNSPIEHPCVGSINLEAVAAQAVEFGIMDFVTNRSSVKAIFVGHNHGLDWCCPYKSLWLCFSRHTGYGGYGTWTRGARILDLVEEPFSLKSWVRLENGTVTSYVQLIP